MEPLQYLHAQFLDILFEGKNKNYGAYELRGHYQQRLWKSLAAVLLLCLLLSALLFARKWFISSGNALPAPAPPDVILHNVDLPVQNIPPPPPPEMPADALLKKQLKFTNFHVVKDNEVLPDAVPPDIDKLALSHIGIKNIAGDDKGAEADLLPGSGANVLSATNNNKEKIFNYVERMPRFPGTTSDEESNRRIMQFLSRHLRFPNAAREAGKSGAVNIEFVVSADGSIREVKAVGADPGYGLQDEAMRVIKLMPAWIPGRQNGRAVEVRFHIPVNFRLQ